jgi:hypothetical protein
MSTDAAAPTRYAAFTARGAQIALLLLAIAIAAGLPLGAGPTPTRSAGVAGMHDVDFYQAVVVRVRRGEPYDLVAVTEQRARNYPVRPFLSVRPPLLATALSWAPSLAPAAIVLRLLALATVAAWAFRLHRARPGPRWMGWTVFCVAAGVAAAMTGEAASLFHEAWAGVLIALSLALRTEKRFAAAVFLGLVAALVRELAMPYLLVMAIFAVTERRRWEAAAFAAALATVLVALTFHAEAVQPLVTAHDPVSPSWLAFGGWRFDLAVSNWTAIGPMLGTWSAALFLPLALLGAASWKDRAGLRLLALLGGYMLGFLFIGRPDNNYWGLLIAPLLGVGLALAPAALRDLWVQASNSLFARGAEPRGASQ